MSIAFKAYETLGDPEKRSKHDQIGADGSSFEGGTRSAPGTRGDGAGQEFHFGGTGFGDFFEQYFSGGSRYGFPQDERAGEAHPRRHAQRAHHGSDEERAAWKKLREERRRMLR